MPDKFRQEPILVVLLSIAPVTGFADQAVTTDVDGVIKHLNLTSADLLKGVIIPTQVVQYIASDGPHSADCISLLTTIDAAESNFSPHIKNHKLQFVAAVRGFDGYTVEFSLAELLPGFGDHSVWLAMDEDGKPLAEGHGPAELIVPDDIKYGRWVR